MDRCALTPKRQLLKTLYRSWRSLGVSARRGAVFPPLRVVEAGIHQVLDMLHGIRSDSR
jgi:hypothetical protein